MRRGRRRGSSFTRSVYNYIKVRDGQTILMKDIAEELNTTYNTIRYCLRWLIDRELIERDGKRFFIQPLD